MPATKAASEEFTQNHGSTATEVRSEHKLLYIPHELAVRQAQLLKVQQEVAQRELAKTQN